MSADRELPPRGLLAALSLWIWLAGCASETPDRLATEDPAPDSQRGRELVATYGCSSCHRIPGISGNPGAIGPPLSYWSRRKFIAGRLPNEPHRLVDWLRNPQAVKPGTAMPYLGISEREAVDMAAFLYSL